MSFDIRIGNGFDIHRLVEDRKLILGGVEIEYEKGLQGHSDADVLIHAIIDAILGSLALDDIGAHFPDTDPKYKDADSLNLLAEVLELMYKKNYEINNIDANIIAQEPKLRPYILSIRKKLSQCLHVDIEQISVKAKTMEHLDDIGRKEAISANCSILIKKIK